MNTKIGIFIAVIIIALGVGVYSMSNKSTMEPKIAKETNSGSMENTTNTETGKMEDGVITSSSTIDVSVDANVDAMVSNIKTFTVNGNNYAFSPTQIKVKKGDTVRITFKNTGGFHDFVIDEFKVATKQINGDAEETVTFVADKSGSFEYYCSVGKHREMGMKGTLIVE